MTHSISCPLSELLSIKRVVIIRTQKNEENKTEKYATVINPLTRNAIRNFCDRIYPNFQCRINFRLGFFFERDVRERKSINFRPNGRKLGSQNSSQRGVKIGVWKCTWALLVFLDNLRSGQKTFCLPAPAETSKTKHKNAS